MKAVIFCALCLSTLVSFASEVGSVVKEYFEDGTLKLTYEVLEEEEGAARGVFTYYYENGKIKSVVPIISDGNELGYTCHGVAKAFFENGKPQSVQSYHLGKRNGVSKLYYEDGKLREKAVFDDDVSKVLERNSLKGRAISKDECLQVTIESLRPESASNVRIDNYFDQGVHLGWVILYRKTKDGWIEEAKRPAANHLGTRNTESFKFMEIGELTGTFRIGVTCQVTSSKASNKFTEFHSRSVEVEQAVPPKSDRAGG